MDDPLRSPREIAEMKEIVTCQQLRKAQEKVAKITPLKPGKQIFYPVYNRKVETCGNDDKGYKAYKEWRARFLKPALQGDKR